MKNHIPCEACRHYLGGGCCRANLEAECREGGGFEAWEPLGQIEEDCRPDIGETILKWASIGICFLAFPLVIYRLYEWVSYLIGR